MGKYRILTVGFDLPGEEFEFVEFDSDKTLLDSDIVLVEPSLGSASGLEQYHGKLLLSERSSFSAKQRLEHWCSEIVEAVNAGKIVIIYLVKPRECYRYTGEKQHSGTGRSRVTTNIVTPISSYEAIPNLTRVTPKSGKGMQLDKDARFLATYWKEFSKHSTYEVEIEGNFKRVLVRARAGQRVLGAAVTNGSGYLLFLPPITYEEEEFLTHDEKNDEFYWTEEALQFGKRLSHSLVEIADALRAETTVTPTPDWANDHRFRLQRESEVEVQISACSIEMSELQERKMSLEAELSKAGNLRKLLFEQGKPLESAIIEALTYMGFSAEPFDDGESEFDSVFVSPEGRCLGEAEGRDNRKINIDKFSQLERNIQEDFARDKVTQYAKGVLFGNAYRLTSLEEREEWYFTEKCVAAAKRVGAALVRTPDLFQPAKYLKENPKDAKFAKRCRKKIFQTNGDVVVFPDVPVEETKAVAEESPSE